MLLLLCALAHSPATKWVLIPQCVPGAVGSQAWLLRQKRNFLNKLEPLGPLSQMEQGQGPSEPQSQNQPRVLFSTRLALKSRVTSREANVFHTLTT